MKTVCITLAKNHPSSLKRSLGYLERSVTKTTVDWWIFDNNPEPNNPDPYSCTYHHLPGRNLSYLDVDPFIQEKKPDQIIFWDPDAWYHKDRIQFHLEHLKGDVQLHGWVDSLYYQVEEKLWIQYGNLCYSSLFETAMTLYMWNLFMDVLRAGGALNIELLLWGLCPTDNLILGPNPGYSIGVKVLEKPNWRWFHDTNLLLQRLVGVEDEKDIRSELHSARKLSAAPVPEG